MGIFLRPRTEFGAEVSLCLGICGDQCGCGLSPGTQPQMVVSLNKGTPI